MAWSQIGQLPFYGEQFPYFDEIDGAMVIAGGYQSPNPINHNFISPFASGGVWRSVDEGVNWERISNDLSNPYTVGVSNTIHGKAYVMGGGFTQCRRGKLTKKWDVTASASTIGTQIQWGNAGSNNAMNLAALMMNVQFGNNRAAFALLKNGQLLYKKEITKGGAPWQLFSHGDPVPKGNFTGAGPTVILPNNGSFSLLDRIPVWAIGDPPLYLAMLRYSGTNHIWSSLNGWQWMYYGNVASPIDVINPYFTAFSLGPGGMLLIGVITSGFGNGRETWRSGGGINWTRSYDFPVPIAGASALLGGGPGPLNVFVAGGYNPSTGEVYNKVWKLT